VLREETIQVTGIRCERCVLRLAKVLEGHEGLQAANANLIGEVRLAWDDDRTTRAALLAAMARGGFHELVAQRH
jgi:cation transport ATPase